MTAPLRYVAIGDSIARGFRLGIPRHADRPECRGVPWNRLLRPFDHPERAYPALVADELRSGGTAVDLDLCLTCSGARTDTYWRNGQPADPVRRVLTRPADLVSVTLGANDVMGMWIAYIPSAIVLRTACRPARVDPQRLLDRLAPATPPGRERLQRVEGNLRGLLRWLDERAACVAVTTYHPGDGSDVVHERFVLPVNAAIRRAARDLANVRVIDLERPFRPHALAGPARRWVTARDGGLHPNDDGQRAIARLLLAGADRGIRTGDSGYRAQAA